MSISLNHDEAEALIPIIRGNPRLEALLIRIENDIHEPDHRGSGLLTDRYSTHFSKKEFLCKCGCGQGPMNMKLIQVLETIRGAIGGPVIISSGFRCVAHNRRIGGAKHSQHCLGNAADIHSPGTADERIARIAERILGASGGVGRYKNFTHVDVRPGGPSRWIG